MNLVYEPPYTVKAPVKHSDTYHEDVEDYLNRLSRMARIKPHVMGPVDDIVGEVLTIHHEAGYAQYIVWSAKPFALVRAKIPTNDPLPTWAERNIKLSTARTLKKRRLREQAQKPPIMKYLPGQQLSLAC